jgi:hypothetical protein
MTRLGAHPALAAAALAILLWADVADAGEGERLRADLESINLSLSGGERLSARELDSLFAAALDLAFGVRMSGVVDSLRSEVFHGGDHSGADCLAAAAAPAISILWMGESVNIGLDARAFLAGARPGTAAYEFFDLASDGFYAGEAPFLRVGSAGLPVWMERTASSAQAVGDPEIAAEWLLRWKRLQPRLDGTLAEVGRSTIAGLEQLVSPTSPP